VKIIHSFFKKAQEIPFYTVLKDIFLEDLLLETMRTEFRKMVRVNLLHTSIKESTYNNVEYIKVNYSNKLNLKL